MKTIIATGIFTLTLFSIFATSCKGPYDCYDPKLAESMKNVYCPQDCPEVMGCNNKMYCNVCEANKAGFRVK